MRVFKIFLRLFLIVFLINCSSYNKNSEKKSFLLHNIALSLMQECKYRPALRELKKALAIDSKDHFLHYSIALVYFQFKQYDLSIKHLKKSLSIKPDFTKARVHLARTFIETGQTSTALADLKKSLKDLTFPQPELIHSNIGLAYYKQKKYTAAEKQFSVVHKIKPQDCFISLYRAKSLYFLNQIDASLDILKKAKKLCANNRPACSKPTSSAYYFSALGYNKKNNRKKALKELNIFLKKASDDSLYITEAKELKKSWSTQ